jgi:hypothetical protein
MSVSPHNHPIRLGPATKAGGNARIDNRLWLTPVFVAGMTSFFLIGVYAAVASVVTMGVSLYVGLTAGRILWKRIEARDGDVDTYSVLLDRAAVLTSAAISIGVGVAVEGSSGHDCPLPVLIVQICIGCALAFAQPRLRVCLADRS